MKEDEKNLKKCSCCQLFFPKTHEYFYTKSEKYKNSFRLNCKKCSNKLTKERKIRKRCKELNCSIDDYAPAWKKQYSETRTKYKTKTTVSKYHVDNLTDVYIKQLLKTPKRSNY